MFTRLSKVDTTGASGAQPASPATSATPSGAMLSPPMPAGLASSLAGGPGHPGSYGSLSAFGTKKSAASVISPDMRLRGDVESEGDVQLEGEIHGTVRAPTLTIAEGGAVYGDIYVDTMRVLGKIVGGTQARVVDLAKSAHVTGDIFHQVLTIETGAYIDGHCKRVEIAEAQPAEPVMEKRVEQRAALRPRSRPEPVSTETPDGPAETKGADRIAQMLSRLENSPS